MSGHGGDCDVIVSGGGPAGLAAAALCAENGLDVTLITGPLDPFEKRHDPRTIALMRPSVRLLEHLELFDESLRALSNPLRRLRLVDDTGGLFTAPEVVFDAHDAGWEAFGWNIPLEDLHPALARRAKALGVRFLSDSATGIHHDRRRLARVQLASGGEITAPVVLAADGRASPLRESAGFIMLRHDYDQVAVGCFFSHSADHEDMSTEYHKPDGPFTTVPMPERRSSLVWMMRPAAAREVMALPPAELARRIQVESHGDLGRVSDPTPPRSFPMQTMTAHDFARERVILVGEAAHAVPPIGAQGLNMSLRDAALAAELIGDAHAFGDDPGGEDVCRRYDRLRRRDVFPRKAAIHLVNEALLTGLLPLQAMRAGVIAMAAALPWVRDIVMRQGLAPGDDSLPRIMREPEPEPAQ
jgi:2-octaprenyl-6-methoxyphenol hydroxylase